MFLLFWFLFLPSVDYTALFESIFPKFYYTTFFGVYPPPVFITPPVLMISLLTPLRCLLPPYYHPPVVINSRLVKIDAVIIGGLEW